MTVAYSPATEAGAGGAVYMMPGPGEARDGMDTDWLPQLAAAIGASEHVRQDHNCCGCIWSCHPRKEVRKEAHGHL